MFACLSVALTIALPLAADESFPIADVIAKFKGEIEEAQLRGRNSKCKLLVEKVQFRFITSTRSAVRGGVEGEFKLLGLTAGGGITAEDIDESHNVVEVVLEPDVGLDGFFEVTGPPSSLASLILDIKTDIEAAADVEPRFAVRSVRIEQHFQIGRNEAGEIRFIAVGSEKVESLRSHLLTLTLGTPDGQGC